MRSRVGEATALPLAAAIFCVSIAAVSLSAHLRPPARASGSYGGAMLPHFYGSQVNVSASAADSRAPSLAVGPSAVHLAWEESGRVYHRVCQGGNWSSARSVAVGEQPVIAVDAAGTAHLAFVNEFGDNFEIYYCRWNGNSWSLPRNVSNTSGISSSPDLAIGPDGRQHVVWTDNTPGYSIIYHGYWDGLYWLNEPIPNATGGAPAASVSEDGVVHVVWQDRDTPGGPYEVYYCRQAGAQWSLPENLSDSAAAQSIIPSIASRPDGEVEVVWQERLGGGYAVYEARGRVAFWTLPRQVSESSGETYLPTVTVGPGSTVYIGWDESTVARYRQRGRTDALWSEVVDVASDTRGVSELRLVVDPTGQLHAAWVWRVAVGNGDVFYQSLALKRFLPIVVRKAEQSAPPPLPFWWP